MKPYKPYKPYAPYSKADYKWFFLLGALLVAVLVAGYFAIVYPDGRPAKGTVTNKAEVAILDEEFGDFIGEGHNLGNCTYIKFPASDHLEAGYGPLYAIVNSQLLIGKTGTVAAITYGIRRGRELSLLPEPVVGSQCYILVLDGYTMPEELWNRPAFNGMVRGLPLANGQFLDEAFILMPWPDWMDFDNPPLIDELEAPTWYWDGNAYVEVNLGTPAQPTSSNPPQISEKPPQGGFPLFLVNSML